MNSTSLLVAVTAIGALAFLARTAVLIGREPGGVDAWYYLAYARAFRKNPGVRVRITQYLLQDQEQSYAPLFPSLLALLPEKVLARSFWAISPGIDCLTLLLLFLLALKLTAAPTVALVAALAYAVSPTLISETRALSPRSFGVFLHSIGLVLLLRAVIGVPHWTWTAGALVAGAALFLSSASAMASYLFVARSLSVALFEPRYILLALTSMGVAWIVSLGHLGRVFVNYAQAVRFWIRHRKLFGSHPILDSRIYGGPRAPSTARPPEAGLPRSGIRPAGLATLAALSASAVSIVFFLVHMRGKKNELTAHVPGGLRAMGTRLSSLPNGGVVCLPGGYSDYVAYQTQREVLWGSHSGSLEKFELVSPVWRERVEDAARKCGVRYLIVERAYVDPAVLTLDSGCSLIAQDAGFDLYDLQAAPAQP